MRRTAFFALAALSLSACAQKLPEGVDDTKLAQAIGRSIGSPSTCVIITDAQGHMVWRGGGYVTCARSLPSCDGGQTTAEALSKSGAGKPARFISCPSPTAAGNSVGWAMGPVPPSPGKPDSHFSYVAVMEGDRALPGVEIQDRVLHAFAKAGF
ncbi:hypothetical protein [Caulobacter sp. SSI4214]|uniref:hypothetical protein n=1 Tax=Caulobacter sp. SSI4214 TaxID=2575739 RepID=UPI0014395D9D|nr:hypothetical protein [Caulobacter sp. SSI4214]